MKRAKKERFNRLRYLCFIGIVAFGFIISLAPASSEDVADAGSEESGELRYVTLDSKEVGVSYSIGIATPPGYDESGAPYPAIFALDGAYYLDMFRDMFYENDSNIIIVGVLNSDRRNIDYMPLNHCNSGGGNWYHTLTRIIICIHHCAYYSVILMGEVLCFIRCLRITGIPSLYFFPPTHLSGVTYHNLIPWNGRIT